MSIRLHIIAEGQTEVLFVNKVLVNHLANFGISVSASCIDPKPNGKRPTPKKDKGGLLNYATLKRDLLIKIKEQQQQPDFWISSMVDLYAFPKKDTPYTPQIQQINDAVDRVRALEVAIKTDINFDRFIPYVQLHEFEALLFCDLSQLKTFYPDKEKELKQLQKSVAHLAPEDINETPENAPSKRIANAISAYGKSSGAKTTAGVGSATNIELAILRAKCPHFNEWLTDIEQLGSPII